MLYIPLLIQIYHDCNDGIKPCQRELVIKIPDSYLTSKGVLGVGAGKVKVFDFGVWNLEGYVSLQTH